MNPPGIKATNESDFFVLSRSLFLGAHSLSLSIAVFLSRINFLRSFIDHGEKKLLMLLKIVAVLATMLVTIQSEPQGPGYLPPSGGRPPGGGAGGHPDDWAGDPANYEFSYEVQDAGVGLDFGHREMRKDEEAKGTYHVLLPDGRTQIVDYVADGGGYRPVIRYEGTATFPAPGQSPGGDEGYKY